MSIELPPNPPELRLFSDILDDMVKNPENYVIYKEARTSTIGSGIYISRIKKISISDVNINAKMVQGDYTTTLSLRKTSKQEYEIPLDSMLDNNTLFAGFRTNSGNYNTFTSGIYHKDAEIVKVAERNIRRHKMITSSKDRLQQVLDCKTGLSDEALRLLYLALHQAPTKEACNNALIELRKGIPSHESNTKVEKSK